MCATRFEDWDRRALTAPFGESKNRTWRYCANWCLLSPYRLLAKSNQNMKRKLWQFTHRRTDGRTDGQTDSCVILWGHLGMTWNSFTKDTWYNEYRLHNGTTLWLGWIVPNKRTFPISTFYIWILTDVWKSEPENSFINQATTLAMCPNAHCFLYRSSMNIQVRAKSALMLDPYWYVMKFMMRS